ncbi:MAG TPA: glycosyltransferase [Cyclobacteriaceae bacterium]|nr:glycosyltransferase [Cyclobacteriaceae bacterium]
MNNNRNTVLILGAFRFPTGDAAAARVMGVGRALRQAGYEVAFAGWEQSGRPEDREGNGRFSYEGFQYYSQDEFRTGYLSPVRRLLRYLFAGSNTLKWLKSVNLGDVKAIVAYHGGSLFLLRLTLLCKLRRITLIADCTEWYDSEGLVGGRFGVAHLDNEFRMRIVNRLIGRLIVISHFLERYYASRFCRVVRVPPTIDLSERKWPPVVEASSHAALSFVYAGVPGKKDLLSSALYAIRLLRQEGVSINLNLLGPSRADLLACVDGDAGLLDDLDGALIFHGRVAQELVPTVVAQSDFSILLRPVKRVSAAGFSTKLVESLAAGVPVFANRTGDIDRYIKDGEEGILLDDTTAHSFVAGARRVLAMSESDLMRMRMAARRCAEHSFVYSGYVEALADFFDR